MPAASGFLVAGAAATPGFTSLHPGLHTFKPDGLGAKVRIQEFAHFFKIIV